LGRLVTFGGLLLRRGRRSLGIFLEEEELAEDDQRKGDGEDQQHALVAAGLLLWIAIFSQGSVTSHKFDSAT
jgi:hypothetical protein